MTNNLIALETYAGEPIKSGNRKIIPFSQALTIRFPFFNSGLVWNRSVSVLEVSPDGEEQVLPIQDVTRISQIFLLGIGALASFFIWLIFRTIRKGQE